MKTGPQGDRPKSSLAENKRGESEIEGPGGTRGRHGREPGTAGRQERAGNHGGEVGD